MINHNILMKEYAGLRGEIIFGEGKKEVPYINSYGKQDYYTDFEKVIYKKSNIVPIGANQFILSKLFNIAMDSESTLRVGHLNDEAPLMKIGVHRNEYKSINYNAEVSTNNPHLQAASGVHISALNYVFGFMVGDGGAREDNITAIAPDYKRRSLFHPIPFRMSNDGFNIPSNKYYGKSEIFGTGNEETVSSYYIKKFDDPAPRIIHAWSTDNSDELSVVDDSVFASTSSVPITTYIELNLSIDSKDCRGFFSFTNTSPRVNEFGLVSGWYNSEKNDYESLINISLFTRPSIMLTEGDTINMIYRLYAR